MTNQLFEFLDPKHFLAQHMLNFRSRRGAVWPLTHFVFSTLMLTTLKNFIGPDRYMVRIYITTGFPAQVRGHFIGKHKGSREVFIFLLCSLTLKLF